MSGKKEKKHFIPVFEILFGGYTTPTKCVAFWRLALNSYTYFISVTV